MPDPRARVGSFFQEISRRRVTRVAVGYCVVALAVLEAADLIVPRLQLPDWVVSFVLALLILGLPIVLALAWIFDVGPEGITRTPSAPDEGGPPPSGVEAAPVARRRVPSLLTLAVLAIAVATGAVVTWRGFHRNVETAGVKRVVVLPFENLGALEDEYFVDGMTDEVRGKLSGLPGLEVIARGSSTVYQGSNKSLSQIAQELDVQYLLTATVRWDKTAGPAPTVHVSPELVLVDRGTAPTMKWRQSFDAALTDVFRVQADIASRVARALDLALGAGEVRILSEQPTDDLTAYDAYLRGEQLLGSRSVFDPVTLRGAVSFYQQAIAIDTGFAVAWARLSQVHSAIYANSAPTPAEDEAAYRAAQRALALAPNRADGHIAMGTYYFAVTKDFERARAELGEALRIAPSNAALHGTVAMAEQPLGRWDSALANLERAQALDPLSVGTARRLSTTLLYLRRYPEALRATERGLSLAPANLDLLQRKAMVFLAQGDLAGARRVIAEAPPEVEPTQLVTYLANFWDLFWVLDDAQQLLLLRLSPAALDGDRATWGIILAETCWLRNDRDCTRAYADSARIAIEEQLRDTPGDAALRMLHGLALAYLGRDAEAIREGDRGVQELPVERDAYNGPYFQLQLARVYLLVGEHERALDRLEPLLQIPFYLSPGWLRIDPTFAPLVGNPRFERLSAGT